MTNTYQYYAFGKSLTSSDQNDLQIKVANSMQKPKLSGLLGPVRIVPCKETRFDLQ